MLREWNLLLQYNLLTQNLKLYLTINKQCASVPCVVFLCFFFFLDLLSIFLSSLDHVYEALLYTDIDLGSVEPDSILNEDYIKLIVKKSGMKYKSAKLKEEKERENTDAVKR